MSSNTVLEKPILKTQRLSKGLGFAYATLGLRAGEARVDAIRAACKEAAFALQEIAQEEDELIVTLSDVATSAYRLLDPRKRVRRIERIQLSIMSERALELPQGARRSLFSADSSRTAS